jgi:hypothetical protein
MPSSSPRLRHAALASLLALAACGGERQNPADRALGADAPPGLALLLESPFRAVDDARGARFSGRVPSLSPREQPRDTLRMGRSFGDSTSFALINAVEVVGGRLVVADQQMSKHIVVIDRESCRIEASVGGHGRGPREFLNPSWFRVESVSPARVWAYDFQNRRETLLRLDEPEASMVGDVRRLEAGQALERPIRAGGRILSSGLFVDYTLLQMDTLGKPLARLVSDPPFKERHMPVRAGRRILNRGFLDADPAGRRLAMAYQWTSRIDFFTADGTRLGSVQGPRRTTPRYRHRDNLFFYDKAAEMAYVSLRATDRYVYALFCGIDAKQNVPQLGNRVHVFRWNGDFVAELQLDQPVVEFAVSGDDRTLYATTVDPYPVVGEWRLPAELAAGASSAVALAGAR